MFEIIEQVAEGGYVSADDVPELAFARSQALIEARAIMSQRELQVSRGETGSTPLAIDALSTARRVKEAEGMFGTGSPEHINRMQGLHTDCHRLIGEWRRKNTYEVFLPVTHKQDENDEFIANGMSVWSMTGDGLVPTSESEENDRRINERVEEATAMHFRSIGGLAIGGSIDRRIKMRTISGCADWSIRAYKNDGISRGGYVPENEKLMIRDMEIDLVKSERTEFQVGLPGTFYGPEVIQEALIRRDFEAGGLSKTELHGTQIIVNDDIKNFVRLLDQVASEVSGKEILMGEEVPTGTEKDYDAIWQEAKERQESLDTDARMVSDFVLSLVDDGTRPEDAPELVEEFVKNLLVSMAQEEPEITTEMFDEKTAVGLKQVAYLSAIGKDIEALDKLADVIEQAPGGGYCGAGSCDLVKAKITGLESDSLKALGFDPKNTLMDKGDRKCPGCGKNSIAYELKKKQKGCTSCGATAKY